MIVAYSNRRNRLADWQAIDNENLKTILCTVWKFGRNVQFIKDATHNYLNMKLLESPIGDRVVNNIFLDSLLIAAQDANTVNYFSSSPPTLEEYLFFRYPN